MIGGERPTALAQLDAGAVEYRLERRGDEAVIVFHGGRVRAGLAMGEDVFASLGSRCSSRPVPDTAGPR
jgi:hypothetical protein